MKIAYTMQHRRFVNSAPPGGSGGGNRNAAVIRAALLKQEKDREMAEALRTVTFH